MTRSGGPEEILSDGETGLLIPIKDPEAIVGAVERLKDPTLRSKIIEKARQNALEQFSLGSMLEAYRGLYERFIRR